MGFPKFIYVQNDILRCFISNYFFSPYNSSLSSIQHQKWKPHFGLFIIHNRIRRIKKIAKKKKSKISNKCHNWIWLIAHIIIRKDSIFNLFDWNVKCNKKHFKKKTSTCIDWTVWTIVQKIQTDDNAHFCTRKSTIRPFVQIEIWFSQSGEKNSIFFIFLFFVLLIF